MLGKNPGQFRKNVYSRLRSSLKKEKERKTDRWGGEGSRRGEGGWRERRMEGRKSRREGGRFLNNQEMILDFKVAFLQSD